jgi:hypothetical protein
MWREPERKLRLQSHAAGVASRTSLSISPMLAEKLWDVSEICGSPGVLARAYQQQVIESEAAVRQHGSPHYRTSTQIPGCPAVVAGFWPNKWEGVTL